MKLSFVIGLILLCATPALAEPRLPKVVRGCDTCHGQVSPEPSHEAPSLDGLARSYLARQIQAFVTGARQPSSGGAICAIDEQLSKLVPVDFTVLAAHYSGRVMEQEGPTPPEDLLARGEQIYLHGRLEAGMQACAVCHGRAGSGGTQTGLESATVAPRIAGQRRGYLEDQIRSFKEGRRTTDFSGVMQRMVAEMTDPEIEAVSAYLSSVKPGSENAEPPPKADVAMPEKAALCQTCHGLGGESLADTFPKISGQSKEHILKQLQDIKSGARIVDVMTPVVFALSDEEMEEVASYFASFQMHRGPYDPFKARRGETLFLNGNLVTGYPACMYCHGVDGKGLPDLEWAPGGIPQLAGQHPGYVRKALYDFKEKRRTNDVASSMANIAAQMSAEEIEDLSHYLYSLGER